jgi:hypothetical protein
VPTDVPDDGQRRSQSAIVNIRFTSNHLSWNYFCQEILNSSCAEVLAEKTQGITHQGWMGNMCTCSKKHRDKTCLEIPLNFLTLSIPKRIIRYKSISKRIMIYRII